MSPSNDRAVTVPGLRRAAGAAAAALMLTSLGLTGCGIVKASKNDVHAVPNNAKNVMHAVQNNKAITGQFTGQLQSGEARPFEVTYVTTGTFPLTVVYAVKPPAGLAFKETQPGSSGNVPSVDIVANSSGEYSCSRLPSSVSALSSRWSCWKLGPVSAAAENKIFAFYTPAHWVAFLNHFSLVAGFAGDQVTSSTMTVNGFSLHCVDFTAPGLSGTSTICSTAQGILGYVKVASAATGFEIKAYSASPPASLFELPPGAKITTPKQAAG